MVSRWFDLKGNVAIITGAGSGIGRASAEAFAEAGASVVCVGVNQRTVAETLKSIEAAGGSGLALVADVTVEESIASVVHQTLSKYGHLDIMFSNAGISDVYSMAHQLSLEDWNRVLAVDLTSVFLSAKHAAKAMIQQRRGKIINNASVWGQVGSRFMPVPAYAAAKGGVVNLTRELAMEYAQYGITVNAVSPGFFNTNLGAGRTEFATFAAEIAASIPLGGGIPDPSQIQGTLVYLASSASDLVTGQIIAVDGGWLAY